MNSKPELDISSEYTRVAQGINSVAIHVCIINIDKKVIEDIEKGSATDPYLYKDGKKLLKILKSIKKPKSFYDIEHEKLDEVYSLYAEIHVYMLFKARGIILKDVPEERNKKTPDFMYEESNRKIYFEVKCPDFSNGTSAHEIIAKEAADNKKEIEDKISQDKKEKKMGQMYSCIQEFRPYNTLAYEMAKENEISFEEAREKILSSHAKILVAFIKKILNMIKDGQLEHGSSFLIIYLGRLPLMTDNAGCLLPIYFDNNSDYPTCETGDLWQVSFGEIGERVYKRPELESYKKVGDKLTKNGILVQKEKLNGLVFVIPGWQDDAKIYSLLNKKTIYDNCNGDKKLREIISEVIHEVSDAYNDECNSHDYKYAYEKIL